MMADSSTTLAQTKEPEWVRVSRWLITSGVAVAAFMLLGAIVMIASDVIGRHLFHRPMVGVIESVSFWVMPAVAMLALGHAAMTNDQIRVTLLIEGMPSGQARIVDIVTEVIVAATALWLAWLSWAGLLQAVKLNSHAIGMDLFVYWPAFLFSVIGMLLLVLGCVLRIRTVLTEPYDPTDTPQVTDEI
jgi:TRAP-type C4-dicarboxylate transport system permease small subunit